MSFPKELHVCVINLERDLEKKRKCKESLNKQDFKFISAVDSKSLELADDSLVTAPIEAIWQSHKLALRDFLQTDKAYCLILEDDFKIEKPVHLYRKLADLCDKQFDLAQIGWLSTGIDIFLIRLYEGFNYFLFRTILKLSRLSPRLENQILRKLRPLRTSIVPTYSIPDSFLPGAHAYVVSRAFAAEILKLNSPTFLATDDFFMAIARMRSFVVFRLRRSLISQHGVSGVGSDRFIQNSH